MNECRLIPRQVECRAGNWRAAAFPTVRQTDDVRDIVRVARANPTIESLPVMNDQDHLVGIIRPEDLHRVLDSEVHPTLLQADDIALHAPLAVAPNQNLLEALRDFGSRDIDTLPVEVGSGNTRRLVGLLAQSRRDAPLPTGNAAYALS